jgi:aryl-alcohol dehydrogenase-like predicted oxidoreductase
MGLVSEQCLYNLSDRMVELEVLPAAETYGLGVIPWSPLAGGMLGGALKKMTEGRRASEDQQKRIEKHRGQIEQYEAFCQEMGEEPADVALAWLLKNPTITAPIIGPRTLAQLDGTMHVLEVELSQDVMARLEEIWPGPGGAAPEAFAW